MILTRRSRLLAALIIVFGLVAASCGSDDAIATAETDAPVETVKVTFQLDWVPNTNHTGFFVADEMGYYADEGIEFELLPYSGGNGDTIVAEGLAQFAISFQNSISLARPAGVPVKAVAAVVQHTVEAIAVRGDADDISSPKDLDGTLYAGFGGPFEVPVMQAVIQADGGTGEFESVILDTAAYEAVYNGSADFVIPFKTWEGIEAELNDEPLKYFEYEDYGIPDSYSVIIIAADDWLAANGDVADRFLRATKKGFEFAAANPQEGGQILIDANPGVFNAPELVFQSAELMASEYYLDGNGSWGTIDLSQFGGYSSWLYNAGIVVDGSGNALDGEPDWAEFIDNSHLD